MTGCFTLVLCVLLLPILLCTPLGWIGLGVWFVLFLGFRTREKQEQEKRGIKPPEKPEKDELTFWQKIKFGVALAKEDAKLREEEKKCQKDMLYEAQRKQFEDEARDDEQDDSLE